MKAYDLVQALNDVDEKYIQEAVNYRSSGNHIKFWRAVAIAACVCLAATLALAAASLNSRTDDTAQSVDGVASVWDETAMISLQNNTADRKTYTEAVAEEAGIEENFYMEAETAADFAGDGFFREAMAADAGGGMVTADADYAEAPAFEKKIIYNVYMEAQTTGFDETTADLDKIIADFGGYCENQNVSNNSLSYRNANFTIRIPADQLDAFLERVEELCTITYVSRSADDVSENYYDVASRLETARTKLERLQQLLSEAEDMEDIISIEDAISDTQWQIDNYGSTITYYDSRVAYSTVTLTVNEVYEVVVEEAPLTFGERITQAFGKSIREFGNFLKGIVIWIVNSWIWLIVIAVILVVLILLIRAGIRKRNLRKRKYTSSR